MGMARVMTVDAPEDQKASRLSRMCGLKTATKRQEFSRKRQVVFGLMPKSQWLKAWC
jgi:hypothetical protein